MIQYKYNPQNASPEELKATFTAREQMLQDLLDQIKQQSKSKSNQHYLVIGPRGIGKTNFLQMIYFGIKDDAQLSESWVPLQFAEEEYSIGTLRDLFEKALEVLKEETDSEEVEGFLERLEEENRDAAAAEMAIEFLKAFSKKTKKKILLMIDNLDLILGDQWKHDIEIKRLRDILMNENFLMLIGAAPTYFDEVSNYDKPLYNFFKTINLEELSDELIEELIRKRAEFDGNAALLERLPEKRTKLKALRNLTGGNPRLILMLYQLLTLSELAEVKDYLQGLLDDLTPYYQYKLKWLSPQQRKIIDSMARLNRAVSPTEIGREARFHVNVVNTNLNRLLDWGYVRLAQQERRKATYYTISERLFRMWHQMRLSRSLRKKIQFFVEFIQIWYSLEEMKTEADRLMKGFRECLSAEKIAKAESMVEHLGYIAAASSEPDFKRTTSDQVTRMMLDVSDLDSAESMLREKIKECRRTQNREELAHGYFALGFVHYSRKELDEAIECYDKTLEMKPDMHEAWNDRGVALAQLADYENAIRSWDEALKVKPDLHEAWHNRGLALAELGRYEEAIKSYDAALKLKPEMHEAWNHRGLAYDEIGCFEEAIRSYDEATRRKPDDDLVWYNRGNALDELGRCEEAVKSYEEALKLKPDMHEGWYNRGLALCDLARYEEAIRSHDEALKVKPDKYEAWNGRGIALAGLGRCEEAIKSHDEALKIKPDYHGTWHCRGTALAELEQYEDAIESYLKGLEFAKGDKCIQISSFGFVRAYLAVSCRNVLGTNAGVAKETFASALKYLLRVKQEELRKITGEVLIDYFRKIVSEKRFGIVKELLSMAQEKGLKDEVALLQPFVTANLYWEKGRDAEVLDRLNPEVREIVEEIIKRADEREKMSSAPSSKDLSEKLQRKEK